MTLLVMNSDKASQDIHSYTRGVKWKPKSAQKIKTLLCAALGTTSGQHGLDACTVYGRCGTRLKNGKALQNLSCTTLACKKLLNV